MTLRHGGPDLFPTATSKKTTPAGQNSATMEGVKKKRKRKREIKRGNVDAKSARERERGVPHWWKRKGPF